MASPTRFEGSPLSSSQQVTNEPYDPIADQIRILREYASMDNPNPKQLQSLYHSAIMLCSNSKKESEAIELLNESEKNMIFAGAPETRAKLFSRVICNLIENNSHANGYDLYKSATAFGIWSNQPDHQNKAKEALNGVGFGV